MSRIQSRMLAAATAAAMLSTLSSAFAQQTQAQEPTPAQTQEQTQMQGAGEGEIGAPSYFQQRVEAPRNAFELSLDTGYSQGFGHIVKAAPVSRFADGGMSIDLGLGYRLSPNWMFGATGGYQFYDPGSTLPTNKVAMGATGELNATYHIIPYARLDPWVKAGVGYRLLCDCGQPVRTTFLHGLELPRVNVGLDIRVDRQVALAPMVGAGLNVFFWDQNQVLDNPRLNTFFFAGIQARLNLGGSYENVTTVASR